MADEQGPQEQKFLTTREVMAALNCSRQTVVNLVRRGKLTKYTRPVGQGWGAARVVFGAAEVAELGTFKRAPVEISKGKRAKTRKRTARK